MNSTLTGFGNYLETEAIKGALPEGKNSPQKPKMGLYPEQINGSAFTAPRSNNKRTWVYRILPSAIHSKYEPMGKQFWESPPFLHELPPDQMRWGPIAMPKVKTSFLDGITTVVTCGGGLKSLTGGAVHLYACNTKMGNTVLVNADADMFYVPENGGLKIKTELGEIEAVPGEIVNVPRGIRHKVEPLKAEARGYFLENYGHPFILPELGPIGANGLANPRDFIHPSASYEDSEVEYTLVFKLNGEFWQASQNHSPFDVVAWHGNLSPYKYDLRKFNTMGSISYDHPDPSIFTVLTSPSQTPGVANMDFVIFPERWLVADDTFRPPYYHRNFMSEYMGLIYGEYDAKPGGFVPGGGSLHNTMIGHGPDSESFDIATTSDLKPEKLTATMAFMFETRHVWHPSEVALSDKFRQMDYQDCWRELPKLFKGS